MNTTANPSVNSFDSAIAEIENASKALGGVSVSAPEAALPPALFFKNRLEGSTIKMDLLPGQQGVVKGLDADNEFTRLNVNFAATQPYTFGTTFLTRDYRVDAEDSLVVTSFVPLFCGKSLWIDMPAAPKPTVQDLQDVFTYLINQDEEKGPDLARGYAAQFKAYGLEVDIEKLIAPPVVIPNIPASQPQGQFFKTVKTAYPTPKVDDCGFFIENDTWQIMVRNVVRNESTILIGPKGSGKTEIMSLVANATGRPLFIEDMGGITDAQSSLQGVHRLKNAESIFELAAFAENIQKAGIYLLDEVNRAPLSVGNMILPLLDSRRYLAVDAATHGEERHIAAHEDMTFFATANLGAEYSGTMDIDGALMDRFFVVEMDYPNEAMERKVLTKRTGVNEKQAGAIVIVAKGIRELAAKDELTNTMSVRLSIEAAKLVADGMDVNRALVTAVLPRFQSKSERTLIRTLMTGN